MNENLIDEALLGEDAQKFLDTPLGAKMLENAAAVVTEAEFQLTTVDPEDTKQIRHWQNRAWLGNHFKEFLEEIINIGENALESYRHESKND